MFLEIKKAEYLEGHKIRLWFNNGAIRDVDLSYLLNGEVFEPLRDINFFQRFNIKFNTIEWENGADFAPEYLYEHSVAVDENNTNCANHAAEDPASYNAG